MESCRDRVAGKRGEGAASGCCSSPAMLAVEAGVPDASAVGASSAIDPPAAGDTPDAAAVAALDGVAANTLGVAAVEALTAAAGDSDGAVVGRLEAAVVDSSATAVEFGRPTLLPASAAISAAIRATLERRACRAAATTIATITANAAQIKAMPHTRLRLGRPAGLVIDGAPSALDVSSAAFTARANRSSMSLPAKFGLATA